MSKLMALKPILSEKAHASSHQGVYMFEVPLGINKLEIKQAVEAQYEVSVTDVRAARLQGKIKRGLGRRSRSVTGQRSATKRAYVSLKDGDSLPIFESIDAHDHEHDHARDEKPKTKKTAKETK